MSVLKKQSIIIFFVVFFAAILDLTNLDSAIYFSFCNILSLFFQVSCPRYYDLPIWEVSTSFGSITALYYASAAIIQSNKQLDADQSPYVVLKNNIGMSDGGKKMHIVMLENIGRGLAANITLTADAEGQISIIDGTNPNSINLGTGQVNNGWALHEPMVVEGLKTQNIFINDSVISDIPDENKSSDPNKSDFYLYCWYYDRVGNRYKTTTRIRHSGNFLKVMDNIVERI